MATLSQLRNTAKESGSYKGMNRAEQYRNVGASATPAAQIETKFYKKPQNNIQKSLEWAGNVAESAFKVGTFAAKKTAGFVANTGVDIVKSAARAQSSLSGVDRQIASMRQGSIDRAGRTLEEAQTRVSEQYKAGKMSKTDYIESLNKINEGLTKLSQESKSLQTFADPVGRAEDVVETGATLLSLGSLGLSKEGAKQAAKVGVKEFAETGAQGIEKQLLRSGAARQLIARNMATNAKIAASETTSQFISRKGKQVAVDLLIKRPLFYQSNISDTKSMFQGILTGDYPQAVRSAAWLAANMVNGGPLGKAFDFLGKGRTIAAGKMYGKGSVIDELSKKIGDGSSGQIARLIKDTTKRTAKGGKDIEDTFRVIVERALRVSGDDPILAAENIMRTYGGRDLSKLSATDIYKDAKNWRDAYDTAQEFAQGLVKKGQLSPEEARSIIPVRIDAGTRDTIADTVFNSQGPDDAWKAVQKMAEDPTSGWGNNKNFMAQLEKAIKTTNSPQEAALAVRAIDAASTIPPFVNKTLRTKLAKLGFTVAEPVGRLEAGYVDPADTRKLVTNAMKGGELFDEGIIPDPTLNQFASFLEKTGMSPKSSNVVASRVLSENVVANLDNTTAAAIGLNAKGDVPKGGQAILKSLSDYLENKKGVLGMGKAAASDIRQLTYREIQEALPGLNLTRADAKQLSKAIKQGYLEVPLEFRGAGDKIVDALYRYNPLHKTYSRIQSALRYSYNPFFRVQERTETALLSRVQANNLIWNKPRAVLDDTVKKLDDARIFSSSMYGEAAQDQVLGRITANITQGQKRDLAGLAMDIAEKKGMTIDELITNHADEIDDALRVVVQYPRKGFLASPLARTLNLAFFPMRYNFKVTKIAAEALAKQPPYIQKAFLHSMFKMQDWLKSDEGILWQQQHQDAIKLLNWVTPINSIAYTLNLLTNTPDELSDFGMLGGLPMGLITQMLDSQGIISTNNPYVDKKTGDTFPKYVPESAKARAATAVTDLLGSMFTYPGRTLGLPGKGEGLRALVGAFIDTNGTDFEKRIEEGQLTDLDRKWIEVIKKYQKEGKIDQDLVDQMYNMPAPGKFNWYTLPPNTLPFKTVKGLEPVQVEQRTGLPTKASLKSAKKKRTKKIAQPIQ